MYHNSNKDSEIQKIINDNDNGQLSCKAYKCCHTATESQLLILK